MLLPDCGGGSRLVYLPRAWRRLRASRYVGSVIRGLAMVPDT